MMLKFFYLILLMCFAMGTIGGIGYACYAGEWVIAVAVAVLGVMAAPTAVQIYYKLME